MSSVAGAGPYAPSNQPPIATVRPVTDDYFGTKVTDRFRYMESRNAGTIAWMKARDKWSRAILGTTRPKQAYLATIAGFCAPFGLVSTTALAGGRAFYLEREPGADQFNLKVKDGQATRPLTFAPAAGRPWEGAELAARLEEMPNHRPVLYRLEERAGHGLGSTKATRDAEEADITAFILWHAGAKKWQPTR